MENKEQTIKMLVTVNDNETKCVESIDDAINKLSRLHEDFNRKHSEAFSRYMKLCETIENTKERIEKCQKQLDELSASDEKDVIEK